MYNLVPNPGEPAKLGFVIGCKVPVFLETEVAWESDWHESFTIKLPFTAEISGLSTLISRLITSGRSGNGTYLTNPTTCFDPNEAAFEHTYSTWFRAESNSEGNPPLPQRLHRRRVQGSERPGRQSGDPGRVRQRSLRTFMEVSAGTDAVDSPAAATVTAKLPFDPVKEGERKTRPSPTTRKAEVSLPAGMGLNPSGAQGLEACTDAQFKKGVRTYTNECPTASKIGTVEVESPPLAEPLEGNVYVGEQQSNDPESGKQFRILLEAKSEAEGINARLVGLVKANKTTGNLTAVVTDELTGQFAGKLPEGLPQVPFEEVRLHFDGAKNILTSPPICSAESTSQFEPWARPGRPGRQNPRSP